MKNPNIVFYQTEFRNTLSKVGREDLLQKLLPAARAWRKNKNSKVKDTFNDTVTFTSRKKKRSGKRKKRNN